MKIAVLDEKALMDAVKDAGRPLRLDDILRAMHVSRRLKKDVLTALHDFARNGAMAHLPGGYWIVPENRRKRRGRLSVQRSGSAFLLPEGDDRSAEDVFLAPGSLGDAWNGDLVEVLLLPRRHGAGKRREGRVLSVLERAHDEITVRVLEPVHKGLALCRPVDALFSFDILADVSALEKKPAPFALLRVRAGEKLSGGIRTLRAGTATTALGREDDVSAQELLTKLNRAIPTDFPEKVLAEAEKAADLPLRTEGMEDLRGLALVTMDGEDARDFDDAVFVSRGEQGWRLLVAIADVSYYVRPRTALDREAFARGNSCYFPASVEPMLPETLCNGMCSLRPGEDRRVLAVDMELDAKGSLKTTRFRNALMRSRARLTYRQAQETLDEPEGRTALRLEKEAPGVPAMLREAAELARLLIERRHLAGGLDFDLPEAEFQVEEIDGAPRVTGMRNRERLFSHRLIEAFMIRANESVAEFLSRKKAPFLYRVHPAPSLEKLKELSRLSSTLLSLSDPSGMSPSAWLSGLLEKAAAGGSTFIVHRLALRSLMQARYSPEEEGHFGLASARYCHFTSPIRRYADLVNHRALRHTLGLDTGGAIPAGHSLLEIAGQCNARERVAIDAEREIHRRMGCLLLQERVGERFSGVISGVMPFGFFVELEGMPLEGLVRVETLGRDFYVFEEERRELLGAHSQERFRLGQEVAVKLTGVSIGRMEIDLEYQRRDREKQNLFRKKKKGFRSRPGKNEGDGQNREGKTKHTRIQAKGEQEPRQNKGEERKEYRSFRPARQGDAYDLHSPRHSENELDAEKRKGSFFRPGGARREEGRRPPRFSTPGHGEESFSLPITKKGRKNERKRRKNSRGAPEDTSPAGSGKRPRFGKRPS